MLVNLRRIIYAGYLSFRRNGWLSTATVLIMVLALFVLGNLVFLSALTSTVIAALEEKIDVTVYFKEDAPEEGILSVKHDLESLPAVAEVSYISRDEALVIFRQKHSGNALILDALEELGENPLVASVNIKAKDAAEYASISEFLLDKNYPVVDKVNYFENQMVIDRLGAILGTTRRLGAGLIVLLAFTAVLVAFNTVRLAIYTMREEIGIMRLVGATQWFIRGPFLVTGVLYGAVAAVITTLLFFPIAWTLSPKISVLVPSFNLQNYFLTNFWEFFLVMLVAGVGLGVISSAIAIRRYLHI